jgi:hypothetical protein
VASVTGTSPINVTAGSAPVVSINAASTTASGAVQLYNNVNSTSTALALTAAQGKVLQDQITALVLSGTIELAGTIDASTGLVSSVTSVGVSDGYTVGAVLPAASLTTNNTYVIVTESGTVTPPGGVSTVATRGDWFLVSETSPGVYAWTFLNVGFDAPVATTSVAGIVCLSTDALAQAGTDSTTALTPAAAASAYIPKTCVTAKGSLVTGDAPNNPVALAIGTDGQVLVACSTASTGLCWVTVPATLPATPTTLGTLLGCTLNGNVALGCFSQASGAANLDNVSAGYATLCSITTGFQNTAIGHIAFCKLTTGNQNVAVGSTALCSMVSGLSNDAVGALAMQSFTSGNYNVSIGGYSLFCYSTGCFNTAIGHRSLTNVTTGGCNTALGGYAGENITTGTCNVMLGQYTHAANPAGSCQLTVGYAPGAWWIRGDSAKNVCFGAGIRDCAGNLGTAGQVLTTTGSAIQWASPTKQYISATKTSQQALNVNNTVQWEILTGSGISYFFGAFNLTVGKTYLITTSLAGDSSGSNTVYYQWKNNSGLIGPTLRMASELDRSGGGSLSYVYPATAGNNAIQLVLAGNVGHTLLFLGNSTTIVEV